MTREELITLLKKAKAKKQVVGLKLAKGEPLIGRITEITNSNYPCVTMGHYGCTVRNITAVRVYKPSSWKQIRNKQ